MTIENASKRILIAGILGVAIGGCGGSGGGGVGSGGSTGPASSSGGKTASDGSGGTGGSTGAATGKGGSASGGTSSTGGTSTNGGTTSLAGQTGSGGRTGGASTNGGTTSSAGQTGAGGVGESGGATSAGGTTAAGGQTGAGGTISAGGSMGRDAGRDLPAGSGGVARDAGSGTGGIAGGGQTGAGGNSGVGGSTSTSTSTVDCNATMPSGGTSHSGSNVNGTADGLNYGIWSNGSGGTIVTFANAHAFSASWNNGGDFLAHLGLDLNGKNATAYTSILAQFVESRTGSGGGYSSVGMYGWTQSPCVEWYIVEDSFNGMPTQTSSVTQTIDGGTYYLKSNSTSGTGGNACEAGHSGNWTQMWSVRKTARNCGTITISDHFAAWKAQGWSLGNLTSVHINVEAGGGNGSISFPIANVTAN